MKWAERRQLKRLQAGDREAWAELIREYQARAFAYLYALCDDRWEAEDLCQEVFLRAWAGIGRFQGRTALELWLLRIARNLWIDLGRQGQVTTVPMAEAARRSDPDGTAVEAAVLHRDRRRRLLRALSRLAPENREAVVLCRLQGYTLREAAEIVGVPDRTLSSRLQTALRRLYRILREEHADEDL